MRRRDFISFFGSSTAWLLCTRRRAFSQQAGSVPHVGVLVSASEPHPFADALGAALERLGYSEGRNIVLEVRYRRGVVIVPHSLPPSLFVVVWPSSSPISTPCGESRNGGR